MSPLFPLSFLIRIDVEDSETAILLAFFTTFWSPTSLFEISTFSLYPRSIHKLFNHF